MGIIIIAVTINYARRRGNVSQPCPELQWLTQRYESDSAEFIIMTGRRRVGKTALLNEFSGSKDGVYFLAYIDSADALLRNLSAAVWRAEHGPQSTPGSYGSWLGLFQAIHRLSKTKRFVFILDEYPYLAGASSHLASVIQKMWDEHLQYTKLFFVLCSSYMSVIERDVLNRDAPLYGRRSGFTQPLLDRAKTDPDLLLFDPTVVIAESP
jgi:uncharacterized protein